MTRRPITIAGVTPLLDTLFLLLFALLAVSETKSPDSDEHVRIRLPEVEPNAQGEGEAATRIGFTVDADSRVYATEDGALVDSRTDLDRVLDGRLAEAAVGADEIVVQIRADAEAKSGVALELLQHLLLRGFVRVELLANENQDPDRPFGEVAR